MIELSNICLELDAVLPYHEDDILLAAAKACDVNVKDIKNVVIIKKSIDARKKSNVHFVCTLGVSLKEAKRENKLLTEGAYLKGVKVFAHIPYEPLAIPDLAFQATKPTYKSPVVIGSGPAGLFAALYLAKAGLKPLLLERGADVDEREKIIDSFFKGDTLNPHTNIQFGEGGAGTFSDGKLSTNTKNPLTKHVLQWFIKAGAPDDIAYLAKPHIGTDKLRLVIKNMRKQIEEHGGEVRFLTQVIGLKCDTSGITGLQALDIKTQDIYSIPTTTLVLACGHSARDTFEMLRDAGLLMEQKPFSMGVRIEHLQKDINRAQYGDAYKHPALGAADYKLAVHLPSGRGVYTFCMCPGGVVVPAASEEGGVCTNGMSYHVRDGKNSNAALLVGVNPSDFPDKDDVLAGISLQRKYEQAAYELAQKNQQENEAGYCAPAQTVGDFLSGKSGTPSKTVQPTYSRGVAWEDLRECLPDFVADSIAEALPLLDRKLKGFADPEAVMTGVETRSSSPVRIVRDANFQALKTDGTTLAGFYPCGEGPGYAGGIMSAAVDGLRAAQEICLSEQIVQAAQDLRAGKCVLFPTDTVYGLGVAVDYLNSPLQLFEIKQRSENKPIAWLVKDLSALEKYGQDIPEWALWLAREYWPGPLTLIVKAGVNVPKSFASQSGSIGLRMPRCPETLRLLREIACPLATTSANFSGLPPAIQLSEVPHELKKCVASSIQEISIPSGLASTVVDCTGEKPHILRLGSITLEEINRIALR